jgi:hypothetical protein
LKPQNDEVKALSGLFPSSPWTHFGTASKTTTKPRLVGRYLPKNDEKMNKFTIDKTNNYSEHWNYFKKNDVLKTSFSSHKKRFLGKLVLLFCRQLEAIAY